MKKIFVTFVTAALLTVCLCVPASAADESSFLRCSHLELFFDSGTFDGLALAYDVADHYVYCTYCDVYSSMLEFDGAANPHLGDNCDVCWYISSMGLPIFGQLPSPGSAEGIFPAITNLVTASIDWLTAIATCIVSTPLLLCFVLVSFVGLGVGLIKRVIHL